MALKQFVKASGGTLSDAFSLPPSVIRARPGFNLRPSDSPATIAARAKWKESIRARGWDVDRPLFGRNVNDEYLEIIDGHTRFEAVQELLAEGVEIDLIPCRLAPARTSDQDAKIYMMRDTGEPLDLIAMADGIKQLIGYGWTEQKIADRLGKKPDWVKRSLEAADMPIPLQEAVKEGSLAVTEALSITRHEADPVAVLTAAKGKAQERGERKVRPRDVQAVRSVQQRPTVHPAQKAIQQFIAAIESGADLDSAISILREQVP